MIHHQIPEILAISAEDTWAIRHQVMWPDRELAYVMLPNDQLGKHYGLFLQDQLISVISFFVADQQAQFRKFATLQAYQGKGYGSKLLRFLFVKASDYQIDRIWCNARKDKINYYKKFGMWETKETLIRGGIDYVIMEKNIKK